MVAETTAGEARDQSLHFLMCFAMAFIQMLGRVHLWAIPIALATAYGLGMIREYYQHNRTVWINRDLYFCGAGAATGVIVPFIIWN